LRPSPEKKVLPKLKGADPVFGGARRALTDLIAAVKAQGLEGLVAKRRGGKYAGPSLGLLAKTENQCGQELVIGGYTVGTNTFDALVFRYYEGDKLIYAARTRNGFTPATRAALADRVGFR
jgi:ATP-dependent DNA ligase